MRPSIKPLLIVLLPKAETYIDRTCVVGLEVYDGLTTAGNLDLVLRAEPRHHCIVASSVT